MPPKICLKSLEFAIVENVQRHDLKCCDSLVHSSNPNDGGSADGSSAADNGAIGGGTGHGSGSMSGSAARSSPTYTYHHATLNQKKCLALLAKMF